MQDEPQVHIDAILPRPGGSDPEDDLVHGHPSPGLGSHGEALAGFTVIADRSLFEITGVGFSVEGPASQMEALFGTQPVVMHARVTDPLDPFAPPIPLIWTGSVDPLIDPTRSGIQWKMATPALSLYGPAPTRAGFSLSWMADQVSSTARRGEGVTAAIVDTGLIHRIVEEVGVRNGAATLASPVWDGGLVGVWAPPWPRSEATRLQGARVDPQDPRRILLGIPAGNDVPERVKVIYRCLHPYFRPEGDVALQCETHAVASVDPDGDEHGHGTAVAACLYAVAPRCRIASVKYTDTGRINAPVAAFTRALQLRPDIIVCSWVMHQYDPLLMSEVSRAVEQGVVVIFGGGNGHTDAPGICPQVVSHPRAIVVGGAEVGSRFPSLDQGMVASSPQGSDLVGRLGQHEPYEASATSARPTFTQAPSAAPIGAGGWPMDTQVAEAQPFAPPLVASGQASGFVSAKFRVHRRHCPDLAGLMGPLVVPVQPGNRLDRDPEGGGTTDDGWVSMQGTSLAAPQVAGVVAQLIEHHGVLRGRPDEIKNILLNSTRDIDRGTNALSEAARPGWDPACGWGLVDGAGALGWLEDGDHVFIRSTLSDRGRGVSTDRVWGSPDIIVRRTDPPRLRRPLGLSTKHLAGLGVFDGSIARIGPEKRELELVARIQNRSTAPRRVFVTAYAAYGQADLEDPTSWDRLTEPAVDTGELWPGAFHVQPLGTVSIPDNASGGRPVTEASIFVLLSPEPQALPPPSFADPTGQAFTEWARQPTVAWRWFQIDRTGGR